MPISIHLIDDEEHSLFSVAVDALPRVGDKIGFTFHATDESAWSSDAWEHHKSLDRKNWEVVGVYHEVRQWSVTQMKTAHIVQVKEIPND